MWPFILEFEACSRQAFNPSCIHTVSPSSSAHELLPLSACHWPPLEASQSTPFLIMVKSGSAEGASDKRLQWKFVCKSCGLVFSGAASTEEVKEADLGKKEVRLMSS